MSRWSVSKEEALELTKRDERTRQDGGASLADVETDMREDMVKELRVMVRRFSGRGTEHRELLEALVIAETEGVTSGDLADVLDELRAKLERNAA